MKILHVEDFFHPEAGYQINILPKYMTLEGHDNFIITSKIENAPQALKDFFGSEKIEEKDENYYKTTGVRIIRVESLGFISGRNIFSNKIYDHIKKIDPDVLYIHGNDTLTAIRLLLKIKKIKSKVVMDSHMLEMASKNTFAKYFRYFYKKIITPIIIKNNIPVIRTQNDSYVEKFLGIPISQSPWISVGSDTLLFHPNEEVKKDFRFRNQINDDDFVVLYTGKIDSAKGGKLLAEAFKQKIDSMKKVVLIIVGSFDNDYGEEVKNIYSKSENKILFFPTQKYEELPEFYQSSDIAIFPKQCSLSFYDAQACGLPVIAEDNNINIDRLSFDNGTVFQNNNINDLREKISFFANLNNESFTRIKENSLNNVNEKYNYMNLNKKYLEVIKKL